MHETQSNLMKWLLSGDVSIQYIVSRDLLDTPNNQLLDLQNRIAQEGFGKKFLNLRDPITKMWGQGIYSPKWISTHYTLLELKNMGIAPKNEAYCESVKLLLNQMWKPNGKVREYRYQDVCVSAMMVSMSSYANVCMDTVIDIVDYLLKRSFPDGGWNCRWQSKPAPTHSSLHTTLSVLEAFHDFELSGNEYRSLDIKSQVHQAKQWIMQKRLFRSETTGEIIHPAFLQCPYPSRWKYDILRALDYFASTDTKFDQAMTEAISNIKNKVDSEGKMPVEPMHPGKIHFRMESKQEKSRWNTYRMLKVMKAYDWQYYQELLK